MKLIATIVNYIRNHHLNSYHKRLIAAMMACVALFFALFIPVHLSAKKFESQQLAKETVTTIHRPAVGKKPEIKQLAKPTSETTTVEFTTEDTMTEETTTEETTIEETTTEEITTEEPTVQSTTYYGSFSEDEIDLLCRIVNAENGAEDIPDWVQKYTTAVILNRVNSSKFPNTIYGVVSQVDYINGKTIVQYSTFWNGMVNRTPSSRVIENVYDVLENGCDLPEFVVGQSLSTWDGCKVYETYDSDYGTEYFFWW